MLSLLGGLETGLPSLDEHLDHVRNVDWEGTSYGSIETWPRDLLQLIHVMMLEPQPRVLMLGPGNIMMYNPAFGDLLGDDRFKFMGTAFSTFGNARFLQTDLEAIDNLRPNAQLLHVIHDRIFSARHKGLTETSILDWTIIPLCDHRHGNYVSISRKQIASRPRDPLRVVLPPTPDASFMSVGQTDAPPSDSPTDRGQAGRLYDAMESSDAGVFVFNPKGTLVEANEAWYRYSRHPKVTSSPGETPHSFMDYVYPPDAELVMSKWTELAAGSPTTFEMRWKAPQTPENPEGSVGVLAACVPYFKNGCLESVVGCTTPIALNKEKAGKAVDLTSQEATRRVDELLHLQKIVARASVGICEFSLDGTMLWANEEFHKLSGIPKDIPRNEMASINYVHPDSLEDAMGAWQTVVSGQSITYECRWKAPLNEYGEDYRWCLAPSQPILDDDGNCTSMFCCLTDISAHKRLQMERKKDEERLFRIMDACPIGITMSDVVDGNFNVTYTNDRYHDMLGFPRSHLNQNEWPTAIYEGDLERVMAGIPRILAGEPVQLEYRIKKPWVSTDGHVSPSWMISTASPDVDENGVVSGCIFGVTDISGLKWAERMQNIRIEEALEAKRQQENFVDMTSHEIRNPLGAVVHCADSLLDTLLEMNAIADKLVQRCDRNAVDRLIEYVENGIDTVRTITSCTAHQKRIVDDILILSKLDSNLLQISPVRCHAHDILKDLERMFNVECEREMIEFRTEVDSSLSDLGHEWLWLDLGRINQVLINLLTNAIKFIKNRSVRNVTIRMGLSPTRPSANTFRVPIDFASVQSAQDSIYETPQFSEEGLYLWFTIEDTGIGMTTEERMRIFSRFAQGSPRTYGEYGGSGLGLFISATLSRMQGGEIGVASQAGVGSTFAFFVKTSPCPPIDDLPRVMNGLSISRKPSKLPIQPVIEEPAARRITVLVTEDNLLNQKVLKKQLSKYYHVETADNGQEALDLLRQTTNWQGQDSTTLCVDIVLMDIEMPVLNGLDTARRIRNYEKTGQITRHIPIIAVSANARPAQMGQAIEAGMDDSISKPFRIVDLLPKIDRLVSWAARTP